MAEARAGAVAGCLRRLALPPVLAQLEQRFGPEALGEQREHMLLFAAEVLARGRERGFEEAPGFGAGFSRMHPAQAVVYFLMLLVQALEFTALFENMIQRQVRQLGLGAGMLFQQRFHNAGQGANLSQGDQAGQRPFDLIKHAQKNDMLGQQCFDNAHIYH